MRLLIYIILVWGEGDLFKGGAWERKNKGKERNKNLFL